MKCKHCNEEIKEVPKETRNNNQYIHLNTATAYCEGVFRKGSIAEPEDQGSLFNVRGKSK
jgi:hypothetical protein